MRGSVSNQPTGRIAEEPSAFKYEREESKISHVYLVCLSIHLYLYFKEEPVFNTSLYPPEILLLMKYQSLQFQMSILTKVLIYLINYHLSITNICFLTRHEKAWVFYTKSLYKMQKAALNRIDIDISIVCKIPKSASYIFRIRVYITLYFFSCLFSISPNKFEDLWGNSFAIF